MPGSLKHYSVDVSFCSNDEQNEIYKQLEYSCWIISPTDVSGIYDVFWEIQRGDISKLPFLPAGCVILPLP